MALFLEILLGLLLGLATLAGVAFFALRAGDKPMRRNENLYQYDASTDAAPRDFP
jgi:hypothetical protein